ncbi:MAG: ACT domain-containing protein [Sedimentisphaerales bacterium]|jgi:hypothetical protein
MRHDGLTLSLLPGEFAVCRLEPERDIPEWATRDAFWSVTKTLHELSIVCCDGNVPEDIEAERGWRILEVESPLDFSMTGVLNSLTKPLAESRISVFVLSTYLTDYVMIRQKDFESAIIILRAQGHRIEDDG